MQIQSLDVFLDYLDKVQQRTMRVVRCIPAGKLDWSYREGKFTLGELVRHMGAIERYMFGETIQGKPSLYSGCGKELADGLEEVIRFKETTDRETVEIVRRLGEEGMTRKCTTPDGASITVWKWLRLMVEHEIHHRGQIYLYLGMLNVPTPPLYGLTSEQVSERRARVESAAVRVP
ncbi:MAG TPA: DinB family protein [Candidatus Binatia bacterium]|nr:DinB family protein [Candidatus Binatia bacterium]